MCIIYLYNTFHSLLKAFKHVRDFKDHAFIPSISFSTCQWLLRCVYTLHNLKAFQHVRDSKDAFITSIAFWSFSTCQGHKKCDYSFHSVLKLFNIPGTLKRWVYSFHSLLKLFNIPGTLKRWVYSFHSLLKLFNMPGTLKMRLYPTEALKDARDLKDTFILSIAF